MNPSAADLSSAPPKFIYITPSHQYPTGAVMSLPRRRQLIDYAQQSGAWLLEDDYDSEFRYSAGRSPLCKDWRMSRASAACCTWALFPK